MYCKYQTKNAVIVLQASKEIGLEISVETCDFDMFPELARSHNIIAIHVINNL
jgi:hypothetical protein